MTPSFKKGENMTMNVNFILNIPDIFVFDK